MYIIRSRDSATIADATNYHRSIRLSPQYPYPCSLQDALAAYLYLISPPSDASASSRPIHAHNIVLYGDSSGGALALSLLIVLRDAGIPMPAGCVLLSPWVDLTHSFPSVLTNAAGDYIPAHGFHYRPSLSWPPIRGDPMVFRSQESKEGKKPAELIIKEQIQLYCSNSMISHPMVSLVNQGSLGGLPPLSIVSCRPCYLSQNQEIYSLYAGRLGDQLNCWPMRSCTSLIKQLRPPNTHLRQRPSNDTHIKRKSFLPTSIPLLGSSSKCLTTAATSLRR